MKEFPENHFDAIVTDPPYGLEFMGKEWDRLRNNWQAEKLGFRFVGIEKDAGYYRIAEKRIAAIMPGLFPGEGA
jgi:DNA modification methylase